MIPIVFLFIILECNALGDLSSGANDFSIELVRSTGMDNVVIGTFSVWSLMASLSFWAVGEFKEQLFNVLRLPRNTTVFLNEYSALERTIFDKESNSVNITSKIFVFANAQYELYPEFEKTMVTHFRAVIETINFENDSLTVLTELHVIMRRYMDYLFTIFDSKDFVNTTMLMSSTTIFEGQFKSKFNISETTLEQYDYNNKTVFVYMMQQTLKLPFSNIPSLNADVMELELGDDGKFSLLLIVPNLRTNMKVVYNKLNTVTLKDIFNKLQSDVDKFGLKEVHLKLPKDAIRNNIILNKPLSNMGLKLGPEKSEFSGIVSDDLHITTIDHSCEIHIGETGIYAIASTPRNIFQYNTFGSGLVEAEQPFIFFVMEKTTQTIMLGGLYSKPFLLAVE